MPNPPVPREAEESDGTEELESPRVVLKMKRTIPAAAAATKKQSKPKGRPKGSKNKPKDSDSGAASASAAPKKSVNAPKKDSESMTELQRVKAIRARLESILNIKVNEYWHVINARECGIRKLSKCFLLCLVNGHKNLDTFLPPTATAEDKETIMAREVVNLGRCYQCGHHGNEIVFTFEACLKHEDEPGMDYEDDQRSATVRCANEKCNEGFYIQGMCEGWFDLSSGKNSAHCRVEDCGSYGLGKHLGDYREDHCYQCGRHYWAGFACPEECPVCFGDGSHPDHPDHEKYREAEMKKFLEYAKGLGLGVQGDGDGADDDDDCKQM